jgi:ubiquitin C-terminal hydrolase
VLIFCSCFVVGLHDGACDEWRADRCRLQNSSFKELRVVVMEFILLIAQLTVLLNLQ